MGTTKTYEIPYFGKIYLNYIPSNSGDSIFVNLLKDGEEIEEIYETDEISKAESYVEGFLEHLVRSNKNITAPRHSKREKGWSDMYVRLVNPKTNKYLSGPKKKVINL